MMLDLVDSDEIQKHLELLHQRDETIEIRYRYRNKSGVEKSWGKTFESFEDATNYAADKSSKPNTIAVWTNLNRIDPDAKIKKLVNKEHIIRRAHIVFDFDTAHPKDTNSTEDELQAAISVALKAAWYLHDAGFPGFILLMSGNGAQLVAAIDEPVDGDLVERVLEGMDKLFTNDKVKVDCSVGNLSRVAKLAGTAARKGPHSEERPHRMASILRVFGQLTPTPTEVLELLAVKKEEESHKNNYDDPLNAVTDSIKLDLPAWLTANDVPFTHKVKDDGTDVYEVPCPWKPNARTTGGAALYQDNEGTIHFYCNHDSCRKREWKDYYRKIDPHFRERVGLPTKKNIKDAEYHARCFLYTLPPSYLYRGEIWLYVDGIWQQPDIEEMRNMVCKSLMRVFGQYRDILKDRKSNAVAPSVTESLITNVLRCLKSILPEIPRQWDMPCWIDGTSANVLVVENGILNLATYRMRTHTSKLFARFKLPYIYDKDATCPKFMETLETIFDDPAEILLAQEEFGATLVGGNDRRVVWLWQGVTHGGKGLLTKILCYLVGLDNCISIRAASFKGQFALWNARGKMLIVVPDINGKKPLPGAFVEATKIISGGDAIDIDGKNKQGVHEILPAKILLVTNDILKMNDDSAALFNRFKCLKFLHHFFPVGHRLHEPGRPQNEKLEAELLEELPGILNWALEGLRRVDAEGFTTPQASVELQDMLETEGAPIQIFAHERLVKDVEGSEYVTDVYEDYCEWCIEHNIEEPFSIAHFGSALKVTIPAIYHKREPRGERKYRYHRIRRKTEEELNLSLSV